jgi:NAD-dependent SIR2 family protein deacetylase
MRCVKKNGDQICDGPIKPDITFFGESLPDKFMKIWENLAKTKDCDLLIVIGTALAVSPFN